MNNKRIKYDEGQWFAVPLSNGSYALGIVVRGSYKTKGGLGYFFGPAFPFLPEDEHTWERKPEEAILVCQFGDLGIINGRWPIIHSTRPFSRDQWPIPKFGSADPLRLNKGFMREYMCDDKGELRLVKETFVDLDAISHLPDDSTYFGGAVEIRLTKLLDEA